MKSLSPGKPVILLTGFGDMLEPDDKKARYADLVMTKPVTLADLRQTINRLAIEIRR